MSYKSIDYIQKVLSDEIFHYTKDRKKAAGRALGTFIEIITYYLLKQWKLDEYTAIERPLREYGNSDITHNVEFTLHPRIFNASFALNRLKRLTGKGFVDYLELGRIETKSGCLIDKSNILKNAFTFALRENSFYNAYFQDGMVTIAQLRDQPVAMIECKRVGVEEGMTKGPQTIEKAKQGSYVARTVSSLQRFIQPDGKVMGIIPTADIHSPIIDDYYHILENIMDGSIPKPQDFILTVGVVSNHGNWFTASNMNKELRVLAKSFDWLIFLTDEGLAQFVEDLLLSPKDEYAKVRDGFICTYSNGSKLRAFTKTKMFLEADAQLRNYFENNLSKIETEWFEILSPQNKTIFDLKESLFKILR
ncbi:MAG: hypothetical protein NC418_07445 [Muribaculaceae bacterium]|nr:hypothetical protein [Muribaculaceae bacterium]